jgi:hypothetical protein
MKGRKVSAKTRAKEAAAQKGKKRKPLTAARRAALSKANKGRHRTAAQKAALSKRMKGRHPKAHKATAAQKAAESKRMTGKKHPHKTKRVKPAKHTGTAHVAHHHVSHVGHHSAPGQHKVAYKAGHVSRRLRTGIRAGRIYPSRFVHGRTRLDSRFKKGRRARGLRAPFVAGRRRVRQWK